MGDLDGNCSRVESILGQVADCDIAILPEMVITGYPLEDLVLKSGFVSDSRRSVENLAATTTNCAVLLGFADSDPAGAVYNAVAVCQGGEIHGVYHKRHLPNYSVFDEARHFCAGSGSLEVYRIGGVRVGVTICEDLWVENGPAGQLVTGGAELLVVANGSPYYRGKAAQREAMVTATAISSDRPLIYVNLVGGQVELVFDGGSMAANRFGEIVARGPQFDEAVVIVDIEIPELLASDSDLPVMNISESRERIDSITPTSFRALDPLAELYGALVLATRDYIRKSGFTDICVGLSGGVDSALVATIAADALGPSHVHCVLMPSRYSSTDSVIDAEALVEQQALNVCTISIESAHKMMREILGPEVGDRGDGLIDENLQARIRGVLLMALSNASGWLVLTTGNKSEAAVGYSTLYGDTAGAYAPIKDVYKTTVYELCHWRNAKEIQEGGNSLIPDSILLKPPSAELRPDQRDDQSLPPYEVLDPLLEAYIEGDRNRVELVEMGFDQNLVARVVNLVDRSEYKRRQTPHGVTVTSKGFGRDRRLPVVNRYRG